MNLYDNANGYNNAAGLLADQNHFPGIDMVRFGENISIIQKRVTFENRSILEVYEKAIEIFRDYYQYEEIKGADKKKNRKNTRSCISRGDRQWFDSQDLGCGIANQSSDV